MPALKTRSRLRAAVSQADSTPSSSLKRKASGLQRTIRRARRDGYPAKQNLMRLHGKDADAESGSTLLFPEKNIPVQMIPRTGIPPSRASERLSEHRLCRSSLSDSQALINSSKTQECGSVGSFFRSGLEPDRNQGSVAQNWARLLRKCCVPMHFYVRVILHYGD